MYYALLLIALILVFTLVVRVVSSVIKSLLIVLALAILGGIVYVFVSSASSPVDIFGLYTVDNFKITKSIE